MIWLRLVPTECADLLDLTAELLKQQLWRGHGFQRWPRPASAQLPSSFASVCATFNGAEAKCRKAIRVLESCAVQT